MGFEWPRRCGVMRGGASRGDVVLLMRDIFPFLIVVLDAGASTNNECAYFLINSNFTEFLIYLMHICALCMNSRSSCKNNECTFVNPNTHIALPMASPRVCPLPSGNPFSPFVPF